jgi:hypothetical protein
VQAVTRIVGDLALMQKARHTYGQTLKPQILAKWQEEAEKAQKPEEPAKPPAVGPQPPKPGDDDEGKKEGPGNQTGEKPSDGK